jgi:tetratricopeptide (TPR) repeat protein
VVTHPRPGQCPSPCHEQSLALKRDLDDRHGEGQTLNNLGIVYRNQARWEEAIACYGQSVAIMRELGEHAAEKRIRLSIEEARRAMG